MEPSDKILKLPRNDEYTRNKSDKAPISHSNFEPISYVYSFAKPRNGQLLLPHTSTKSLE